MVATRYKKEWYDKRIKQNKIIKKHLIRIIMSYKENTLNWTKRQLRDLNYEDLFEIAVAAVNKNDSIVLGAGRDWSCGRDGKVSIVRTNSYGKKYSAGITGCLEKEYILALVYEPINEKFYYFSFPPTLVEHTIPFEVGTGMPKRETKTGTHYMWENYECKSFEEMVTKPYTLQTNPALIKKNLNKTTN